MHIWVTRPQWVNALRPRQDGRHFADDIFTCIFFNENCRISIKFSLKYVRKGPIDINPALVQIMAWRRSGDKPLPEPMMISLPTHICVTRPQWVKACIYWGVHLLPWGLSSTCHSTDSRHVVDWLWPCIQTRVWSHHNIMQHQVAVATYIKGYPSKT